MRHLRINLATWVPIFFILLYLLPLGMRDLWSPDELRYAEISREMVSSGDWVVPRFNDLRYFEKPVMGYWMNAVSQLVFGETNFAVRAASAFSALGAAFCIFLLLARFASRPVAWLTSGIYLSMFMVSGVGTYSVLDSMLNLWLTASFTAFYFAIRSEEMRQRAKYYGLAGFYCGCAVLTKGFLALALPVLVVVPYMLWTKQFKVLLKWGWWVMLLALLTCLPWALAVHAAEPDYWHYFFWVEHIQRFSAEDAQHSAPIWYYLPFLAAGVLPWLFWSPSAISHLKGQMHSPLLRYALLWAVLPLVFFSLAKGKLATYILPIMAPLAILFAFGIQQAFAKSCKGLKWGSYLNAALFALLAITTLVLHFTGKLPLDAEESYRPWLLFSIFGFWSAMAVVAIKANSLNSKVASYMLMPLGLFMLAWATFPNVSIYSKMPAKFMQQISHLVEPNTVLVADYPDTMSAFNWYFKREDVYLVGQKGEVRYGLEYPDAQHRYIETKALARFIEQQRQHAPVMIYYRDKPDMGGELPDTTQRIDKGRYTVLYYQALNQ
ncbi:lipid IV(A) 4-amino-4-deoxy-L-arabinosyltransferase [Agarivorans sp. Toyoura001]|uniref:lipid IV(A) 4-amino-4-deoxy-L-arabinosyltransferase n=1 Tax=unclassified Agarivorans TaxID=2636026 RepID=UPI0010E6D149|nr:lipid IV(A) 4-amino-4-deoxy-L-arabinosyltransferase [Agarivorans sp. Toyoura001]GDY25244.1 undecaprenyl phosphate-alpha-4-amino-4-deoxy-L-arabinose arabinosyl transferase [Agarivorans sp. Toyoura001]